MKMKNTLLLFSFVLIFFNSWTQKKRWQFPQYNVVRMGPYIGIQKGDYLNFELGFERQWKDLKLIGAQTSAVFGGFNYNIKNGIIGTDIGGWRKLGFAGITYGGGLIFRTDFTSSKAGVLPLIGLKLNRFHIQAGYQFLFPTTSLLETNTFCVSLRYKIWSNKKIKKD